MRIIVIEDDETLCEIYRRKLEKYDPDLTVCENGLIGSKLLLEKKFDLIISDLVLPYKRGEDIIKFFRKSSLKPDVPIIIVSGYLSPELQDDLSKLKNVFFFQKPIKWDQLEQTIASHVPRNQS